MKLKLFTTIPSMVSKPPLVLRLIARHPAQSVSTSTWISSPRSFALVDCRIHLNADWRLEVRREPLEFGHAPCRWAVPFRGMPP